MQIIVTEISEGINYYQQLTDWVKSCGYDPDSETFEPLVLMEGDPDIIKYDDNRFYFIDIERDGIKFILTSDHANETEKAMLMSFHGEGFERDYTSAPNTWGYFNTNTNVIAYRGGQGYTYNIWNYTPKQ